MPMQVGCHAGAYRHPPLRPCRSRVTPSMDSVLITYSKNCLASPLGFFYLAAPFIIDSNMAMRLAASDASMALSLCTAGLVARSTDAQSSFPPPLPALLGVAYAPVAAVPGVLFAPLAKYVPGVAASRRNAASPSVSIGDASPPLAGDVHDTCFAFAPVAP